MKNHTVTARWAGSMALLLLLLAGQTAPATATLVPAPLLQDEDGGWPRQIDDPRVTIIIYQPEIEEFRGNTLSGRAAVSVTPAGETTPSFGAIWLTARVDTDRESRMVYLVDATVENVRFPNATPEQEETLKTIVEEGVPDWNLALSMDRLVASLELAERERASADLRMDPPQIIFVDYPAVVLPIDGQPLFQDIEGSTLRSVANSALTLFHDSAGMYYLYAGEQTWFTTADLDASWNVTTNVPAAVAALAPPDPDDEEIDAEPGDETRDAAPPRIIVAYEPTELIVTDGPAEYSPILGTDLLYVTNSESDIVMHVASQRHFVVLSGRWYAGSGLAGPWEHVPPDQLPADFSRIPPESDTGHLLVQVPDIIESNEAVLDQQVPQTAAIDRTATTTVEYDGEAIFEPIEGTNMEYAINTSSQVIGAEGRYFAVDEGVWYVANSPDGPWEVATARPEDIDQIPASNPHYNVQYVYVYDVTPTVVYVGYTPGYTYSYVYGGTVIYGTGYHYVPVYVPVYYPPPPTYGFHVRYNPWSGWGFGFSYSTGRFTFSIGYGGRYGGWGRYPYRRGYARGWHRGYRAGARAGYRAGRRNANRNVYRTQNNRARVAQQPGRANRPAAATAPNRNNNVYTNRNGDVFRQNQNGNFQQRDQNGWQNRQPSATNRSQLERSSQSRTRGTNRTQSFKSTRSRSGGRGGRRGSLDGSAG